MGIWVCFKLVEVSYYLGGKADETFITAKLMSIIVVIELFFCIKFLMAGFTLKECIGRFLRGILIFVGDSLNC